MPLNSKIQNFLVVTIALLTITLGGTINSFAQSRYRLWSNRPSFTILLENQNELGFTSPIYDNVWEGDKVLGRSKIEDKVAEKKKWAAGEGIDYLDPEVHRVTGGRYNNARRIWEQEGYPIGNGRLGAMVFNGSGRDRYALNEISYWSGGQNAGTINNRGDKKFDGRIGPDEKDDGFGGYQPIGDLIADFGAPVKKGSFTRSVDINQGEVVSEAVRKGVKTSSAAFASYPDQTIVISYRAGQPGGLKIKFSYATQRPQDMVFADNSSMTITGELKNGIKFKGKAIFLKLGGTLTAKDGTLELNNADACTIILAQVKHQNSLLRQGNHYYGGLTEEIAGVRGPGHGAA
ncbi:glycoside hydrolase N-terminal domain-containing protein [Pedobacter sp. N23S346]|uniref:glycoside hydrolase N-terminal domain-containing protein n=1 Tax=Pedobacter sp. N23S346 TaxID=3402750 RepID=UPI003AD4ECD6